MPSSKYDLLSINFKPSIGGSVAKNPVGSAYQAPTVPVSLTVSGMTFSSTNGNTVSLGSDEFTSAIYTFAAGAAGTINLANLTDLLFQSGVDFARVKGYRAQLLSTANDATYGTACSQVTVNGPIAVPTQTAPATSTSGGSLPATTAYYYKVTAITAAGETTASNEETITTGAGSTNSNTINWNSVPNATGYKIYEGSSSGGESTLLKTISSGSTVTYTHAGGESTSAASPPSVNTAAPPSAALLNGVSPLSGFLLGNGEYQEWATPSANGYVVGSNSNLYIQNNDSSHSAALQLSIVGGTS